MNSRKCIVLIVLMIVPIFFFQAQEFNHLKSFLLSQADDIIIQKPYSFIVTDDNKILIIDGKAADVKFFDMNGVRIGIFGRQGLGPNEFVRPIRSAYKEPLVAIMDFGRKNVLVFKRDGANGLIAKDQFLCLGMGKDFQIVRDGEVLIAGDKRDNDNILFNLYSFDYFKKKSDFLLPVEAVYDLGSVSAYERERDNTLRYIGLTHAFDFNEDSIFFVWKGAVKILKIDRKTKKVTYFGKKTKNFVPPHVTNEMRRAYHERNHRLSYKLDRPMSMVRDIFVTNDNRVGVVYAGPYTEDDRLNVMLQLYTTEGKFIREISLLKARASHHYECFFYFRKADNHFYILDTETTDELNQLFRIYEFNLGK